ncbi:MAG: AAA family ATPase [bacterium]|nr:AAA family ATPase [bacterium]
MSDEPESTAEATLERGTYELLRDRLQQHARGLSEAANGLNTRRLEVFGGTETTVLGNQRIRTDNNCVPRDIRDVGRHSDGEPGEKLLFGYNVFIGLKTETRVEDVLSLHLFTETNSGFSFEPIPEDSPDNFLSDEEFVRDFKELYKYYKETRLLQLRRIDDKLLAVFQTGRTVGDIKVFRWAIAPDGVATYIDNRGERDHVFPPSHDFEWTATSREDFVLGRHPHVSVLDEVFVETVGGDLTVKVEDNTEDGLGIYREPVDEPDQSLDDGEIHYARVGPLILLKILPYNETTWRYLVFNTRNHKVTRLDAIGQACLLLPEDHGLIFPGGYYLQSGETKSFEGDVAEMEFMRVVRSPNGEDVLYVFHERVAGRTILLSYNMIRKEVASPIHCNGFSLFEDGKLAIFRALSGEPTRVHAIQIWQTPFTSDEYAAQAPTGDSFLEKVGNADLVRGISDALSIGRLIEEQEPSAEIYEDLIAAAVRMGDAYYWLDGDEAGGMGPSLKEVRATVELIVDEFEKVRAIRKRAREAVAESEAQLEELFREVRTEAKTTTDHFVAGLSKLRTQRGHLISLREQRYVDRGRLDELEAAVVEQLDQLSVETVSFLDTEEALEPYHRRIGELVAGIDEVEKTADAKPLTEGFTAIGDALELLTEVLGDLEIDDATVRTVILERISEVLGGLNRGRALLEARRKELLSSEGVAEFGAQFKLFSQSVSGAMALADTPEKCDQQLSKLLLQLEDMESRFGEFDEFAEQLATKREDVYEAITSKKQTLLDERQRRVGRLMKAAERVLEGIVRRASGLASNDELNAYFAGDAMVAKVRDISGQLRELSDSVKADELDSRLKSAREDAARGLRDRQDIFEEGATVIKLGRHRFSVNTQPFDLTMVPVSNTGPSGDAMAFHLSGTDFYETVADGEFETTRDYWNQLLVSETEEVYRAEYLAASMLFDAEVETAGLTLSALQEGVVAEAGLVDLVRRYSAERYDEGYERGLHDQDTALILEQLVGLYSTADLLRFAPRPRAFACLFWAFHQEPNSRLLWERRARSLGRLRGAFAHSPAIIRFHQELADAIAAFFAENELEIHPDDAQRAGAYLFEELAKKPHSFVTSAEAVELRDAFLALLESGGSRRELDDDLRELENDLTQRYRLARAWLAAFLDQAGDEHQRLEPCLEEAVALLLTERRLERTVSSALSSVEVEGLLGQHPRVAGRKMRLRLDEFLSRLATFRQRRVAGFRKFQELRHEMLERERARLRLTEYEPKVMSSFVRNRLISDVYLPIIGDNLAKQLGALGEDKRTDQMGLLLLISPPGYGKTTLMEYVANRLGLVFVKINGPALGHAVTSIDPQEASNATARQEIEKISFALEMGNNVLLYLDDIQHTHPELLQKFISLCDAQRRMEGIWGGRTRTYDLRGKRFAVCMAGNPYTEAGEKFQIPDMLANRADTYNLGDILEGKDELFALSYLENALTSNPVMAPLTTREGDDLFKLVRMARGEEMPPDQLSHDYSAIELEELLSVLRKLLRVQEVLLAVNQQYIYSASQDDAYRTEPRFQLQGSYRNMNKLAERIVPVMNDAELEALIDDHYAGESQTLTTGAEHNILKLRELRGVLSGEEQQRWEEIKRGFARVQAMGGAEDDPAIRLIGQLGLVSDRLQDIGSSIQSASELARQPSEDSGGEDAAAAALKATLDPYLKKLQSNLASLAKAAKSVSKPAGDDASSKLIGERLDAFLERLDKLCEVAAKPSPAAVAAPAGEPSPAPQPATSDLTPYLEKLDQTLTGLAESPRGTQVVQTLGSGVHEVLAHLTGIVGDNLLPLVQGIGRKLKKAEGKADRALTQQLDRTLKSLDMLNDLVASLRKIDMSDLATRPAEEGGG